MKVYTSPVPAPKVDYKNYDAAKVAADEDRHTAAVKAKMIELGYRGKHTGKIFSVPYADGHASYLFADGGRKCALIHLPYGDAYHSPDVRFLPKTEVLRRIDGAAKLAALFSKKRGT